MKRKIWTVSSLALILVGISLVSFNAEARGERWVHYVPFEKQVELVFWMKDEVAYINVTITFSSGGFEVKDWGLIYRKDRELEADSEIWRWTGPSILVIRKISHTYNLGYLKPGKYTFTFKAWGEAVQSLDFIVTGRLIHGKNFPLLHTQKH